MNIRRLLKPSVIKKIPADADIFSNGGGIIEVRLLLVL